jgi:hypothetical protein
MLSASLQAYMASYTRRHKSKLYSWMKKIDYLKRQSTNSFPLHDFPNEREVILLSALKTGHMFEKF